MIRWGVIGAGGFADRRAIPGLKKARNARLQAVMVRDLERARALARKHGAPEAYDRVEALLESPNVDAVYLCTPVDLHRVHTEAAAAAGKHVFCEKPMAMSVEDCQAMIRACEGAGVQLGIAYMMRYRPQCQVAKELIGEGRLGELVAGRAQNAFWYPEVPGAWRQDPARGKGGVLADVGSHCVDTLRFLMGEVVEVQGLTASAHFAYPVEDTAVALLRFANQALGMVDCSFAVPHRECPLELYGTRGAILVARALGPFPNPEMRLLDEAGEHQIPLPQVDAYTAEFEAMSQAIMDGRPHEVDGWEGLRITEILLAILRSAERGEPVPIRSRREGVGPEAG
ncbi:MAG: Gfo/Idh/MocA family oxidoreductase [Anaerolineae bacterium]|nr:Gfo/Idh/MocA family oxidoreductase [Anaerolineae bacterium]